MWYNEECSDVPIIKEVEIEKPIIEKLKSTTSTKEFSSRKSFSTSKTNYKSTLSSTKSKTLTKYK